MWTGMIESKFCKTELSMSGNMNRLRHRNTTPSREIATSVICEV